MCFPRLDFSKVASFFSRKESSSNLEEDQFSDFISDVDDDFAPGSNGQGSQTPAPGVKR